MYHNFEHQLSEIVFKFLSQEHLSAVTFWCRKDQIRNKVAVNFLPDSVGTMLIVPISVHLLADTGTFEIVCQCMLCGSIFSTVPWMEKEAHGS